MKRPCLGCGALTTQTRCDPCRLALGRRRQRPTMAQRGYDSAWRTFSRGQVQAEPWCHSEPCPYPDSGTPSNPLTTDHATLGLVLCRRCNSAKQHTDRRARSVLDDES